MSAYGPNSEAVAALIERARRLTADKEWSLSVAWEAGTERWQAARAAAREAAWDARREAWAAARAATPWNAAWAAAGAVEDAALALVVRDLIIPAQFEVLYGPWREVVGDA